MQVAFYVSGRATRLSKVFDLGIKDLLGATKFIFSDDEQNEYLRGVASKRQIRYYCLDYKGLDGSGKEKNLQLSNELLRLLREYEIDYCFSFGDHLLVGDILTAYNYRIINFHPSILPLYPGRKAIDQALSSRSHLLGNTAHFINEGVDEGLVIMQNIVSAELFQRGGYDVVLDQQIPMLVQIFRWLEDDRLEVTDNRVVIRGGNNGESAFFPALEVPNPIAKVPKGSASGDSKV